MRLPCFELRWLLNGMNMPWHSVFSFLFFLFRNNVNKRAIGWKRLPSLYFFPRKYHSGSYDTPLWSQLCSKFFINNHESTWEQHLKDTLQLNIIWTSMSRLHQDIELIIVCFSFSQTSLVFEFKLMLIEWFLPQFIYLSSFWYCFLKFIPYLYALFIRAGKFSWTSMLLLCEGLQPQVVNMFFYFRWNISTCQQQKLLTLIILSNFYLVWKS